MQIKMTNQERILHHKYVTIQNKLNLEINNCVENRFMSFSPSVDAFHKGCFYSTYKMKRHA